MSFPQPFGSDLKVLVLAGSDPPPARPRARPRASSELPLQDKSFLPLRGQLVVEYALDLVRQCGLSRVWVLAAESQLARIPKRHQFIPVVPPDAHFSASLPVAAAALAPGPGEPILVVFGDHPLGSATALQVFLAACRERLDTADFFHGLALQASYQAYSAWFRRTSVHMRGMSGRSSGFSLVIPSRLHRLSAIGELYSVRKLERLRSLFGLMSRLGSWLGADTPRGLLDAVLVYAAKELEKAGRRAGRAARFAGRLEAAITDRVRVERLERYAARVLGAERGMRLVPLAHGGIAIDVDFAEELEALETHWDAVREISARQDAALAARVAM